MLYAVAVFNICLGEEYDMVCYKTTDMGMGYIYDMIQCNCIDMRNLKFLRHSYDVDTPIIK